MNRPLAAACAGIVFSLLLAGCGSGVAPATGGGAVGDEPSGPPLAMTDAANWITFQHDQQRTGYYAAAAGLNRSTVGKLKLLWTYKSTTSFKSFKASPIVVNGVVYVGDRSGQVTALDAITGKPKWHTSLSGDIAGVLSYYKGSIIVGTHRGTPTLAALRPTDGKIRWTNTSLPGALRSYPVVVNGTLYLGSASGDIDSGCHVGGVFAVNIKTGAMEPKSWFTESSTADGGGIWGPISFDGSRLLFGTGNTCTKSPPTQTSVVATSVGLDMQWNVQTVHASFPSQSYDDDDVASAVMVHDGVGYAMGKVGDIVAIDLKSGALKWSRYLGAPASFGGFSSPVITGSTLIVSAGYHHNPINLPKNAPTGGMLYGLSLNGTKKWKIYTRYVILSSPVATPDLVFVSLNNTLTALNPQTGVTLWHYPTVGGFQGSPALTPNNQVIVNDLAGNVYCFGIPSSSTPVQPSGREMAKVLAHTSADSTQYAPLLWTDANGVHVHGDDPM